MKRSNRDITGINVGSAPLGNNSVINRCCSRDIWPAQLGFRGGKGIAVTIGSILVFDYRLAAACGLVFCLCLVCLRKYMLSWLIVVIALPVAAALMGNSAADIVGTMVIAFMILFAHRGNITELIPKRHVDGSQ